MKKIFSFMAIILCTFILCGCNKSVITDISYKEFKEKIDNKESFILYVSKDDCAQCKLFDPKFEGVLKDYNIKDVYKIHLNEFTEKETKEFDSILRVSGTPNVIFVTKGNEESTFNRIDGNISTNKIIERLKANGKIK